MLQFPQGILGFSLKQDKQKFHNKVYDSLINPVYYSFDSLITKRINFFSDFGTSTSESDNHYSLHSNTIGLEVQENSLCLWSYKFTLKDQKFC